MLIIYYFKTKCKKNRADFSMEIFLRKIVFPQAKNKNPHLIFGK